MAGRNFDVCHPDTSDRCWSFDIVKEDVPEGYNNSVEYNGIEGGGIEKAHIS